MFDREAVSASAARAVDREFRRLTDRANEVRDEFTRAGQFGGSRMILFVAQACEDGFHDCCGRAAIQIAEIASLEASSFSNELTAVLVAARKRVLTFFDTIAGSGPERNEFLQEQRRQLDAKLTGILEGAVSDLKLGLAKGENVAKHRARVEVNAQGGIANVISDSPNARMKVTGGQRGGEGWDPAPLLAALERLRGELAAANVPADEKVQIEDDAISLEREAASDQPNPGRLVRMGTALWKRVEQIGLSVAGRAVYDQLPTLPV